MDLQSLVITLASHRRNDISCNVATELLTSYLYDYAPNSRCEYHEELGISFCALGFVKRYAYLISDQLCPIYQIKPIAGMHLPVEKDLTVKSKTFNNEDFRKPTKLLRDSYKQSNSRLTRNSNYDPTGSTRDIRYASEYQHEQRMKIMNDELGYYDDSRSTITSISNFQSKSLVNSNRNNEECMSDDEAAGNDDEWKTILSKSSVSKASSSISKAAVGRGRPSHS